MINFIVLLKNIIIHPIKISQQAIWLRYKAKIIYIIFFIIYIAQVEYAFYVNKIIKLVFVQHVGVLIIALLATIISGYIVPLLYGFLFKIKNDHRVAIKDVGYVLLPYILLQTIMLASTYLIFFNSATFVVIKILIYLWFNINIVFLAINRYRCKKNIAVIIALIGSIFSVLLM